jgi:hypothetical protein
MMSRQRLPQQQQKSKWALSKGRIAVILTSLAILTLGADLYIMLGSALHPGAADKERVVAVLKEAGITVKDAKAIEQLPTWTQVTDLYGDRPIIAGLERCADFRAKVPAERRMLGAAGMFSTGTNLVTLLLKQNCVIPERVSAFGATARKEKLGMRWQGMCVCVKFKDCRSRAGRRSTSRWHLLL